MAGATQTTAETTASHPTENPRDITAYNFRLAADRLGLDSEMRTLLTTPFRELRVEVPVRLDDGSLKVRIQTTADRTRCLAAERLILRNEWPFPPRDVPLKHGFSDLDSALHVQTLHARCRAGHRGRGPR